MRTVLFPQVMVTNLGPRHTYRPACPYAAGYDNHVASIMQHAAIGLHQRYHHQVRLPVLPAGRAVRPRIASLSPCLPPRDTTADRRAAGAIYHGGMRLYRGSHGHPRAAR